MPEATGFELSVEQRALAGSPPFSVVALVSQLPALDAVDEVKARIEAECARHEILRTTVRRVPSLTFPLQFVNDVLPVAWTTADGAMDVGDLVRTQAVALDPAEGPVLAAGIVDSGDTRTLVLSAPTLVADGATLELVAAAAAGRPSRPDPIQYVEYAAWQNDRLTDSGEDRNHADEVWRRLQREAEPAVLPADPSSPDEHPVGPIPVQADGVRDSARWLAAWAVTLARLTGQAAVLLGVELDPRGDPELEGAAGPYARVVPLSVVVPSSGSFDALVEQVRRDHDLALTWLEWAPADRARELRNVFAVSSPDAQIPRPDVQLELRVAPDGGSAWVVMGGAGTPALARRAVGALAAVLGSCAGALADTEVLTPDEVTALLGEPAHAVAVAPVVGRIVEQARHRPEDLAVSDGSRGLNYRALVSHVERLAGAVLAAGADRTAPVGILLPRSIEQVVAMLAAHRAGVGYVPLDGDQPASRLAQQIGISGATVLITDGARPEGFTGEVIGPDSSDTHVLPEPGPGGLSYLIFTSGSTGVPKGVEVPESALANYVEGICRLVTEQVGERPLNWAMVTSPTTDLGNTAIFPALASGGTLHVVPVETTQDPTAFAQYVAAHDIDILKVTPSHLEALLEDESAEVLPRELLILGGEGLPWSLVDRVAARATCQVVNHYGPTETTVGALVHPVDVDSPRISPTVPIGRPLPGVEALVLDSRGRLAPEGATGELAIGGAGLALGYRGDPARTEERFIPHPYRTGQRLYRTGDAVRRSSDGTVTFLGRSDGQIKLRGFRIERGEVEAALRAHPGVQRAAAVVRDDLGAQRQLVGYVVSQLNPVPSERDLREHVGRLVPAHMVPARIVSVDAFPLRPNGKLDESALPAPSATASGTHIGPGTPTEERIAEIFTDVLGQGDIGVTDDFFELGGHSLLATRVVVLIRDSFDVHLPVYALFETPTVRGLAEQVDAVGAATDEDMAALVAELEGMSDEEAAALLAAESGHGSTDSVDNR